MEQNQLNCLFEPTAIAIFGASPKQSSVAGRVYQNLMNSAFRGPIVAINPKYTHLNDQPCFPDLSAAGAKVDLAIIATPATSVPNIMRECGENGVYGAIVLTAGSSEKAENKNWHRKLIQIAQQYNMRFLGPNCLGLVRPHSGLNATFSHHRVQTGSLALVSQSGAVCTAIMDRAAHRKTGLSAVVSLGDATDIGFGSMLDYLALDPQTDAILLYIEGIKDARRFMSGLSRAARLKPVLTMKVGRHAISATAALSHTGALVGSNDVFDAALQRAGAVRVNNIGQLFSSVELLSAPHRIKGNRLAIVTNGGGPGIMATDRALDLGIQMARLSPGSYAQLDDALPANWSHGNPIDILGDAQPQRYQDAVDICLKDPQVDGVLVILTPLLMTDANAVAEQLVRMDIPKHKALVTCWMGFDEVESSRQLFAQHKIPTFLTPENAVESFAHLVDYQRNQALLMQAPGPLQESSEPDISGAQLIIEAALSEGRSLLSRVEVNAILSAFDMPVMSVIACQTAHEALVAAETLGFPLAMKINSPDISHKTEVDGIRLNINSAHTVRKTFHELVDSVHALRPEAHLQGVTLECMYNQPGARELMAGVIRDPVFGPVITFGAGGTLLEVIRDRATALPPLNSQIIENLIDRTRVSQLLGKFRNQPAVDRGAITHLLRRLSELVVALPHICELDINPFVVDAHGATVLDARIVVDRARANMQRYDHMAIHPYPAHLRCRHQLADGTDIMIRPIRPEDANIERAFVNTLSARAKHFRFMYSLHEMTPEMLVHFTQVDYDRDMALIAVVKEQGQEVEIGVARYNTNPDEESCEFALVVADHWSRKGIGLMLLTSLIEIARAKGLTTMQGEVLSDNRPMLGLINKLGFSRKPCPEDASVTQVSLPL